MIIPNLPVSDTKAELIPVVDRLMSQYCQSKIDQAADYDSSYQRMWQTIRDYLGHGGKRIRPYLTVLLYKAYGGKDLENVFEAATGWEFLHASLLVHDDIIDRDLTRHGAPNIAGVYKKLYQDFGEDAAHFADSSALLAGDLLLIASSEIVMESELEDHKKLQFIKHLNQSLFKAGGGQQLDYEIGMKPISESSPEKTARFKTASYSFEYPMISGAELADAPTDQLKILSQLGVSIGVAFQIIDDVLGMFGNTENTGKSSNDNDIIEKKRTALIKAAVINLPQADIQKLEQIYSYSYTIEPSDVVEVRRMIDQSDAKSIVLKKADDLAGQANQLIEKLDIDINYKTELHNLTSKLLSREF